MCRALAILALVVCYGTLGPPRMTMAQGQVNAALPAVSDISGTGGETVDRIIARVEDDVLTESELRELASFQQLVDGREKSRSDLIQELTDQWIVRGEANSISYPAPSSADVDRAYAQLLKQFASPDEFSRRREAAGLTESNVRELLAQQLFLSRFLDYRFRPAAQVDDQQIQSYYNSEFLPQLKARKEAAPPLADVADTIREVLVQRQIDARATQWLDDTRRQLKIDVVTSGNDQ